MATRKLTAQQLLAVQASERTMSALSIIGSLFIMGTFLRWHYFRKPINRLVFFASFGNVMANVATLLSTTPVPDVGEEPSALCQFQGVLIQWFMMADSLWVFCMALNVMLVFFHHYNSRRLRGLEKWYLAFAYGVPFSIAFVYILVEKITRKRIFGPALIWCWIDSRVGWMRIAFFYAPIWVIVCLTLGIYIYTGHSIFMRRRNLRQFSKQSTTNPPPVIANPFTSANMNAIKQTTEISVRYTSESVGSECTVVEPTCANDSRSSFSSTRNLSGTAQPLATAATKGQLPSRLNRTEGVSDQRDDEQNPNYRAAVSAENKVDNADIVPARSMSVTYDPNVRRNIAMEGNTAAWSYFKVAVLMFAALIIVWVPSTVNRLQQFADEDTPLFGLNLASALVLPLQGFWNAMVYISTTWPECKRAIREILDAIAAAKHPNLRPDASRKNSTPTLIAAEGQEFDMIHVPLNEVLEQGPPHGRSHSQMPKAGLLKPPRTHSTKR